MRILFLADNFPPERNAQASRVYERACYWVDWGHQVTVITCAPNFPEGKVYAGYKNRWHQTEEISGIRVVRIKTFIAANSGRQRRILDFISYGMASFLAGLFENSPDVVVATSPQFFAGAERVRAGGLYPAAVCLGVVGPMAGIHCGRWRHEAKFRFDLPGKTGVVHVLSGLRHYRLNWFLQNQPRSAWSTRGKDRCSHQWRGFGEISAPDPRRILSGGMGTAMSKRYLVVGYLGTHGMAHALENVLHAADRLRNEDVRFLFVGAGALRDELIRSAKNLKLENVVFVPAQPKEKMPSFWSLCDVALIHLRNTPLFQTVIPSKLFEAMGMGLPVLLACPSGEASRIITTEHAGLCVEPEHPEALADAVRLLNSNRDLLSRLADCSRAAAPRYSRERQAREYIECLGQIADRFPSNQSSVSPLIAKAAGR